MGFIRDVFLGGAEERAAQLQSESADRAIAEQRRQSEIARADLAPFTQAGTGILGDLTAAATADSPAAQEFLEATRDQQGQLTADTELINQIMSDPNAYQAFIGQAPDSSTLRTISSLVTAGPEQLNQLIASGAADQGAVDALRQLVLQPSDVSFERKEGFDDIASAAAAVGKRRAGSTFRDLTEFNEALNERARQQRIGDISSFVGLQEGLKRNRLNEALLGRTTRLSELGDLYGLETDARSRRAGELLQGRQQALNELGVAGDVQQRTRENRLQDLLTRLGVAQGAETDRYNRLFGLAGLGQSSAAGQANVAQQTGANVSNLLTQQGNALAAGQIGKAGARRGTLFDLVKLAGQFGQST